MDIRQFAYAGIDIYGLLAKATGKSTAEIQANASSITYDDIVKALEIASSEGGQFYQAMERQSQTLNGMISNFKDNLGNFAGDLSMGFTNAIKNVLPSINNLIDRLDGLLGNNSAFVRLSDMLDTLSKGVANFLDNLSDDQLDGLVSFGVALAEASPIMLGLGAILPKVGQGFSALSGGISGAGSMLSSLISSINPVAGVVVNSLSGVGSAIISVIGIFTGLTAIVGVLGFIDKQSDSQLTNIARTFRDKAPTIVKNFVDGFVSELPSIIIIGQDILSTLVTGIENMMPSIYTAVDSIFQAISSTMINNGPQIATLVTSIVMNLAKILIDNMPQFLNGTYQIMIGIMHGIRDNLPSLIESMGKAIKGMYELVTENLPEFIASAGEIIDALVDGLILAMPYLLEAIPYLVEALVQEFMGQIILFVDIGANIIKGVIKGLLAQVPNILIAIGQCFVRLVDAVKSYLGIRSPSTLFANIGKYMMQGLINGVQSLVSNIVSKIRSIVTNITNVFRNINLWSIGANLITGLWNGIGSKVNWIYSKIRSFASGVITKIKNIFGVHSPSKEFAWIGKMDMVGFANGIEDNQKQVQSVIDSAFDLQPNVSPSMSITQEQPNYIDKFQEMINNWQERPVAIEVRADEGIIVQKATQGFREFQRANGRLPF